MFTEQPLIYVTKDDADRIAHWDILQAFSRLSPTQQLYYWQLSDPLSSSLESSVEDIVIAKFDGNSFGLDSGGAIFVRPSRINHSCLPNVEWQWNEASGTFKLVVIRDIELGEELTISYVRAAAWRQTGKVRETQLSFPCDCPACQHETPYARASDRRRALMGRLFDDIMHREESNIALTGAQLWQNFYDAMKVKELLEEEGLLGWELAMSYYIMAGSMSRYGEDESAEYYSDMEQDYYRLFEDKFDHGLAELVDH